MPFRLTFDNTKQLSDGIWISDFRPEDAHMLGRCQTSLGSRSVIGVWRPLYREAEGRLEVEPSACLVLNVGKTTEAFFLDLGDEGPRETPVIVHGPSEELPTMAKAGDRTFLNAIGSMPPWLQSLGRRLLGEIRRRNPGGELEAAGDRLKFVERPDNFWTIKPQFTDHSFAVTVRGNPERFSVTKLVVKPDRPGYSRFKVKDESDLEEAISVILSARRRRM